MPLSLLFKRAERLLERGLDERAASLIAETLRGREDCVATHVTVGFFWLKQARPEMSLLHFSRARILDSQCLSASLGAGRAFFDKGEMEESLDCLRQAHRLDAEDLRVRFWLGRALSAEGRFEESLQHYSFISQRQKESPTLSYHYAVSLFSLGRLREGFRHYEGRERRRMPDINAPHWQGETPKGQTILVYQEQGFGDTIQFLRYVQILAKRGAEVVLQVDRALEGLSLSDTSLKAVVGLDAHPEVDLCCSVMSLPYLLQPEPTARGDLVPYIFASESRFNPLPEPLEDRPFKVGVCCSGHPGTNNDRFRRPSPGLFSSILFACSGVTFYSLQKESIRDWVGTQSVIDLGPALRDFSVTANFLSQLDLVLTVDTAVAHLAGAMNLPVCILLPYTADWRWQEEREDSPWYPSARLLRQREKGDWNEVLREARELLRERSRG